MQRSILALSILLAAVAHAQPGRFPCGSSAPNQRTCESLSHPTARRGIIVPVDSQCATDAQCDFGSCTAEDGGEGVCNGGLGDSCEGPDGPDDSLCAGNLGCQVDAVKGKAVCGGLGADCSFSGSYQPAASPNNGACLTNYCNPATLTCGTKPKNRRPRPVAIAGPLYEVEAQQQRYRPAASSDEGAPRAPRPAVPAGASCPVGFNVCPITRKGSQSGFILACFDTSSSATHCGGCTGANADEWNAEEVQGVDCTALPGVASSACVDSTCRICTFRLALLLWP
ncbi:hypothetical protein Rhopal_004421-T1 [Rhodotorula paludigena]|uniref:Protein CPL1-like domain-containing protein n=1 Tax=Rhodotorula paludigena TaxID=86838 RepID=A0AAV5GFS9_9BASI|nr:hypothetical protein Rhopal_004421-T1 [Rhodotorula paludigena]